MADTVIDCLLERGFIDAITSEELKKRVEKPLKVYVGFDPTADSLHLGSLVGIVALKWFQKFGHTPVVILGGATGRIGDPSGKDKERPLLTTEQIGHNIAAIAKHFEAILDFSDPSNKPLLLNNAAWFSTYNFIEFLRDVGKHFRMGPMLAKESVRARLQSEEGMSFTEFSYQLIQAYDFYHLVESFDVSMQMGGSDQWGNITAGIELIRKLSQKQAYGLTFPLLTRSDGKKFGKSEEGAIWLSSEKCSPYQFYQYLYRVSDIDVIKLMRMLTFIDMEEIRGIEEQMTHANYEPNSAQRRLAEEVTLLVHGQEGLETARRVTQAAAPGTKTVLDPEALQEIAKDMPHVLLNASDVMASKYVDLLVAAGLATSKGEASRLIMNGGAYLNNERVSDVSLLIDRDLVIGGRYLLLGSGKKKKILVEIQ
jgi:tyrosyl-tRNA synthetase